jgi:predicted enzyme related to lactoylglutathione lyase
MQKVIGLGGVFMQTENQEATHAWYAKHLGVNFESWGTVFQMDEVKQQSPKAYNVLSFFKKESTYRQPSTATFMLNLIVADLDALVAQLKLEEVEVLDYQASEYGKFAWVMDPNGVKVELWEP